jgi:hypothetical protein
MNLKLGPAGTLEIADSFNRREKRSIEDLLGWNPDDHAVFPFAHRMTVTLMAEHGIA